MVSVIPALDGDDAARRIVGDRSSPDGELGDAVHQWALRAVDEVRAHPVALDDLASATDRVLADALDEIGRTAEDLASTIADEQGDRLADLRTEIVRHATRILVWDGALGSAIVDLRGYGGRPTKISTWPSRSCTASCTSGTTPSTRRSEIGATGRAPSRPPRLGSADRRPGTSLASGPLSVGRSMTPGIAERTPGSWRGMSQLILEWDGRLEVWTGHVDPPGTGPDPAIGPAGPAGVAVLRAGDAVVNTCTTTGRITDVYLHDELDQEERDALALLFEDDPSEIEARLADQDHRTFHLTARPATDRRALVEVADLLDALTRVDLSQQPEAQALALAELVAALGELGENHGSAMFLFGDGDLLTEALASADRQCGSVNASDLLRFSLDRSRVQALVDRLRSAQRLAPRSGGHQAIDLLEEYLGLNHLGPGPRHGGGALIDAVRPDAAEVAALAAPPSVFTIRPSADAMVLKLSREAANVLRLPASASVERTASWVVLTFRGQDHDDRAPATWLRAFDPERHLIGAGQLHGRGADAVAELAVPPGSQVAEWEIESNPFGRPDRTVPFGRLDHAVAISRAALVARRTGRSGLAEVLFARATIAWTYLGQTFRAAWAWSLADQQSVREDLRSLGWGPLDAALDAVVATGDIPADPGGSVPLWMHAADVGALAPTQDGGTSGDD